MIYCQQIKTYLTVIVNGEGHVGSDDVVEADLAVLRRAVGIQSLHAHDAVEEASLRHRGLVATLDKHRGELVDVIHTHVHGGPEREGEEVGGKATKQGQIDYLTEQEAETLQSKGFNYSTLY